MDVSGIDLFEFRKAVPEISLVICEPIGRLDVGSIEFALGGPPRRGRGAGDLRAGCLGLSRREKRLIGSARPVGRLPDERSRKEHDEEAQSGAAVHQRTQVAAVMP